MVQLPSKPLPQETAAELADLQARVDQLILFGERVVEAKRLFSQKNSRENQTFKVIREVLSKMCSGSQRCCYCEDSAADEVEHIRPKNLYPDKAFVWENYLYACGPCNGPKNNRFAVFDPSSGAVVHLTRQWTTTATKSPSGDPLLIDPRCENPLDFFELDIRDTFQFVPAFGLDATQRERAIYTQSILRLNERDLVVQARKTAYGSYVARLKEYVAEIGGGRNALKLALYHQGIRAMDHPTVWKEIQRQCLRIPDLALLFQKAPEAHTW